MTMELVVLVARKMNAPQTSRTAKPLRTCVAPRGESPTRKVAFVQPKAIG
jgi:hypothetical protein